MIDDELIASDRLIPPVLLGDLNATPYDEDMRVLTGKVPEAGVGGLQRRLGNALRPGGRLAAGYTARWPLPDLPRAARPVPGYPRSWRVDDAGSFGLEEYDGVVASDHYGVFANLELTDPF